MKKSPQNTERNQPSDENLPRFDFGRTLGAVVYLLRRLEGPVTPQRLMCLLYIADRKSLLTFGDTITGLLWKVTPDGPFSEELQALFDGRYGS